MNTFGVSLPHTKLPEKTPKGLKSFLNNIYSCKRETNEHYNALLVFQPFPRTLQKVRGVIINNRRLIDEIETINMEDQDTIKAKSIEGFFIE